MELPTYKEHGIGPQAFGKIEYANLHDELRRSSELESALDRLSQWAYKKMESRAKAAGETWAADNPVTDKQLETAMAETDKDKRNANLARLIRGDAGTVTGAAIADVQIGQIRSMLELNARNDVASIEALAKTGEMSPGDVLAKLNAISIGSRDALIASGGSAAIKEAESLQASIAAISQPVFGAVADNYVKQHNTATQAAVHNSINKTQQSLRPSFSALENAAPEGVGAAFKALQTNIETHKKAVLTLAITSGDASALQKLDNALTGAKVAAITGYLAKSGDMSDALKAVSQGDIGNLTLVLAGMSDDEKVKLNDAIRVHFADETTADARRDADLKKEGVRQMYGAINAFIASGGTDENIMASLIELNQFYGSFPPDFIASLKSAAESAEEPDYAGRIRLLQDAISGKVAPTGLLAAAKKHNLSNKDAWAVFSQVVSADAAALRKLISAAEDVGDGTNGTPEVKSRMKGRMLDIYNGMKEANSKLPAEKQMTNDQLIENAKKQAEQEAADSRYQKRLDQANTDFADGNLGLRVDHKLTNEGISAIVRQYEINLNKNEKVSKKQIPTQLKMLKAKLLELMALQKSGGR